VEDDLDVPEASIGGNGADACPDPGTVPLVRWEWTGSTFEAEGPEYGTSITVTSSKEPGEPVEAQWISEEYDIQGAVVFGGGDLCTYDDANNDGVPDSGTVESCERGGGQPNVGGQTGGPQIPGLPIPLSVWALAAVAMSGLVVHRRW
jgi:hypothetical protein